MAALGGWAVSYERGTPVVALSMWASPHNGLLWIFGGRIKGLLSLYQQHAPYIPTVLPTVGSISFAPGLFNKFVFRGVVWARQVTG